MRIKIRGKGNTPSTGGWIVTDENDVAIRVERIKMDANSEKVTLELTMFDAHDIEIETDAEAVCEYSAQFIVNGTALCSAHAGAARYLFSKNVMQQRELHVKEAASCPCYRCGAKVL